MYVIRKAQEHHRNVELHLCRKVCLLVRPSVRIKLKKAKILIPGEGTHMGKGTHMGEGTHMGKKKDVLKKLPL